MHPYFYIFLFIFCIGNTFVYIWFSYVSNEKVLILLKSVIHLEYLWYRENAECVEEDCWRKEYFPEKVEVTHERGWRKASLLAASSNKEAEGKYCRKQNQWRTGSPGYFWAAMALAYYVRMIKYASDPLSEFATLTTTTSLLYCHAMTLSLKRHSTFSWSFPIVMSFFILLIIKSQEKSALAGIMQAFYMQIVSSS